MHEAIRLFRAADRRGRRMLANHSDWIVNLHTHIHAGVCLGTHVRDFDTPVSSLRPFGT
jgi:hypothetical protein